MLAFLDHLPHPNKALVTSRERVELRGKERVFTIGPLSEEDAVRLLMELAPYYGVEVSAEDAGEIGRMLGGIPSAIRWVLSVYQGKHMSLESLRQYLAEGLAEPSIKTSLRLSYERLSEDGRKLFRRLAVFAAAVGERTIEHVCQVENWEGALRQLTRLSLVDVQGDRYRMHPVVRQYALARLEEAGERFDSEKRVAEYFRDYAGFHRLGVDTAALTRQVRELPGDQLDGWLLSRLPEQMRERYTGLSQAEKENLAISVAVAQARAPLEAERANIGAAIEWAAEAGEHRLVRELVDAVEPFLTTAGYWRDLMQYERLALAAARAEGNERAVAVWAHNLAVTLDGLGRKAEAETLYSESLETSEQLGDRAGVAQSLHNIGAMRQARGDYEAALDYYRRSLEIKEQLGDRVGVAQSLHQIGMVHQYRGDYDAALAHYRQAGAGFEELGARREQAAVLHQIGTVHQARGDYDAALAHYRRSLEMAEQLGDRAGLASSLHQIGMVHQARGDYDAALEHYRRSLEIAEQLGNWAGVAKSLHNIGTVHQARGDYGAALDHYRRSLEILEQLGDRSGVAASLHQLGVSAQATGDYAEARRFYAESLHIKEQLDDKSGVATNLHQLGVLAQATGDYSEARRFYTESLRIAEELSDKNGIALTLGQLGQLAEDEGDYRTALQLWTRALVIFDELRSPNRRLVTSWMARLREKVGEVEFWEILQAGIEVSPETLRPDIEKPTNWVVYFVNLAAYHEQQEDWRAAANTYRQAQGFINLREATADDRHRYAEISHRLGVCLRLDEQQGPAVEQEEEAFRRFKELRDFHGQGRAYLEIARAYQAMNSYDLAVLYYRDAYRLFRRAGDVTLAATAKEELGNLEYYLRILKPATADWEEAARLYEQAGRPGKVAIIRQNLAQVQAG